MGKRRKSPAASAAPGHQLTFTSFVDTLTRRAEGSDPQVHATRIFLCVLALMGLGLLVQASHASTTLDAAGFERHLLVEGGLRAAGLLLILGLYRVGPRGIRPVLPAAMVISGILLVCVFVPPFSAPRNGSSRWVELFGFGFQPSEIARLVLVVWIADRCVRLGHRVYDMREGIAPMLCVAMAFFLLVLVETDLGGALLLLICSLSTMWVGGARALPMAASLVAAGGGTITALSLLVPYVRARVGMWFGNVSNNQVDATLQALRGAGLTGTGLGRGSLRNTGVPYLNSDYVFAQVGEELGLLGLLLVAGLVSALLWNSLRLVLSVRDRFSALAAFGLLLSVGLQAMLHMQVVAGLAPPKGTTLPFISDGGTSLLVSSLAVGLALGAARSSLSRTPTCNPSNATVSSPSFSS